MGLLILGGLLIEMAFNAAVPMSFKYLVDYAIVPRNEKVLFAILAGLTGGVVVVSAAGLGCDYLYAKFSTGVLNDLRWRMFTHLQRLSMNFFARSQAADILARFSTDLAAFENALELAVVECVLPALELVLSAFLLFTLNWQLAIIAMLAVPICLMGPRLITPRAVKAGYQCKQNQATTSGNVQENIASQPVIKAFGLEKVHAGAVCRTHRASGRRQFEGQFPDFAHRTVGGHWHARPASGGDGGGRLHGVPR